MDLTLLTHRFPLDMTVILNGESRDLGSGASGGEAAFSVSRMLGELGLDRQPVLVEVNGLALLKKEFDDHDLHDGDRIEIVRMVAGG
ncbi:MAG: sulfur carrier protein ThiS [Verrucomicrobiae bacterium]|nr:sulfur carrier protein ThiS [Verrucomicrobiae bacterium]